MKSVIQLFLVFFPIPLSAGLGYQLDVLLGVSLKKDQDQFPDPCLPEDTRGIRKLACLKPSGDTCNDIPRPLDSDWEFVPGLETEKSYQKKHGSQNWTSSLKCVWQLTTWL